MTVLSKLACYLAWEHCLQFMPGYPKACGNILCWLISDVKALCMYSEVWGSAAFLPVFHIPQRSLTQINSSSTHSKECHAFSILQPGIGITLGRNLSEIFSSTDLIRWALPPTLPPPSPVAFFIWLCVCGTYINWWYYKAPFSPSFGFALPLTSASCPVGL